MNLNPKQLAANNYNPIAVLNLSGNSTTVSPGIPITFDGTQSYDPDNTNIIAYNWWYVDGVVKSQGSTADKKIFSYTFTLPAGVNSKTYQIKLTVRDNEYITASKTITVTVHNGITQTEYYLTDHLGSIRTTIDQNGTVIGFDDYDPFGNVLPGRSYNAGTPNDLNKFTGHERDQEGGLDLDYMLARNYDSELGRFYSVDPMLEYDSPFVYVGNNPLNLVDLYGMSSSGSDSTKSNANNETQMDVQGAEVVVTATSPAFGIAIPTGLRMLGLGTSATTSFGFGVGFYGVYLYSSWLVQHPGAVNQNSFIPYSAQLVQQQYLWSRGKLDDKEVARRLGTSDIHAAKKKIKANDKIKKVMADKRMGDNPDIYVDRNGDISVQSRLNKRFLEQTGVNVRDIK